MNSYKQSLYSGIVRIAANVLMLGAVFFAMHQASLWYEWPSELIFCIAFFGVTVPVWLLAWAATRKIRRLFPAEAESLVDLPRRGPQLVRWSIAEAPSLIRLPDPCRQ